MDGESFRTQVYPFEFLSVSVVIFTLSLKRSSIKASTALTIAGLL